MFDKTSFYHKEVLFHADACDFFQKIISTDIQILNFKFAAFLLAIFL